MDKEIYVCCWNTNIGLGYFKDKYEQTLNIEEAKQFNTEKQARKWFDKEFKDIGVLIMNIKTYK